MATAAIPSLHGLLWVTTANQMIARPWEILTMESDLSGFAQAYNRFTAGEQNTRNVNQIFESKQKSKKFKSASN